jgi:hypothetical protein
LLIFARMERGTTQSPEKRGPGRPAKLGPHQAVSCRLPVPLFKALKHLAVDQAQSLNDVVIEALTEFWKHHPERRKYAHLVEEAPAGGKRK